MCPLSFDADPSTPCSTCLAGHPWTVECTDALIIRNVLSVEDVAQCRLAGSTRTHAANFEDTNPELCTQLCSEAHDVAFSGQHVALYLHRGGHFASGWPALVERLVATMRQL